MRAWTWLQFVSPGERRFCTQIPGKRGHGCLKVFQCVQDIGSDGVRFTQMLHRNRSAVPGVVRRQQRLVIGVRKLAICRRTLLKSGKDLFLHLRSIVRLTPMLCEPNGAPVKVVVAARVRQNLSVPDQICMNAHESGNAQWRFRSNGFSVTKSRSVRASVVCRLLVSQISCSGAMEDGVHYD